MLNRSDSIVNLSKALFKFQSSVRKIGKDAKNLFLKNDYATLPNILDGIDPILNDSDLVVMQHPEVSSEGVALTTVLMHGPSGEYLESTFSMAPVKKDPQGIGSCITYMRRYALTSILKLNIDDDDDGNHASGIGGNYRELLDKIELSGSIDELSSLVDQIKTITNVESRDKLRKAYAMAKARLLGVQS